jgi:orotate phosphoribosyltransferase
MGRGKMKEHGAPKDRFFLGEPKGKIVVLEDVTTTGGSLLATVDQLKQLNVDIIAAIALTNRNEKRDDGKTVSEALAEKSVTYYSMSDAVTLIHRLQGANHANIIIP